MKNERFFYMVRVAQLVRASDCGSEGSSPIFHPRMRKGYALLGHILFLFLIMGIVSLL